MMEFLHKNPKDVIPVLNKIERSVWRFVGSFVLCAWFAMKGAYWPIAIYFALLILSPSKMLFYLCYHYAWFRVWLALNTLNWAIFIVLMSYLLSIGKSSILPIGLVIPMLLVQGWLPYFFRKQIRELGTKYDIPLEHGEE